MTQGSAQQRQRDRGTGTQIDQRLCDLEADVRITVVEQVAHFRNRGACVRWPHESERVTCQGSNAGVGVVERANERHDGRTRFGSKRPEQTRRLRSDDPMVVERARRVIRLRDGQVEADERRAA